MQRQYEILRIQRGRADIYHKRGENLLRMIGRDLKIFYNINSMRPVDFRKNTWGGDFDHFWVKFTGSTLWLIYQKSKKWHKIGKKMNFWLPPPHIFIFLMNYLGGKDVCKKFSDLVLYAQVVFPPFVVDFSSTPLYP